VRRVLLVDAGNSRLKACDYSAQRGLDAFTAVRHNNKKPAIDCLIELIQGRGATYLVMVSVLGKQFELSVEQLCAASGIQLRWVRSAEEAAGIKNSYSEPELLGSDRFVAMAAARHLYEAEHCIVVDCGTAVTVDALTGQGEFVGGVIMPGLQLWGSSLRNGTRQLDDVTIEQTRLLAKDTASAIGSGSLFGLISAIEGVTLRMQRILQDESGVDTVVRRIMCGGDAEQLNTLALDPFELHPRLVLQGLVQFIEA